MSTVRLPERGDAIRRRGSKILEEEGHHIWYGIVVLEGPPVEYIIPGDSFDANLVLQAEYNEDPEVEDVWCYADPNREDHADIPEALWDLRRKVLAGEV